MRHRSDGNQTRIVADLRKMGYSVAITSQVGSGFPDIVIGAQGLNVLLEVKDPAQPPSKRVLTPAEQGFSDSWRGQYDVVETLEEAVSVIKRCVEQSRRVP